MRKYIMFVVSAIWASMGFCEDQVMEPVATLQVTSPPESLKASPFYRKYLDSGGLPILSSERVPDAALLRASELINHMLVYRSDIRKALVESGVRFVVIGAEEQVTDIPEYSRMEPKEFWNERSRGFGGRVVSCGEENLLCHPVDRYDDENILIHEFAHCMHGLGLRRIDKEFDKKLKRLYEAAVAKGLWKDTYAGSSYEEYWAEGVQSYFDANRENNYNHNPVNTREELQAYDPDLARLISETFRYTDRNDWRYKPLAKQPGVTTPPQSLKRDPFYKKFVNARGLPIFSSEKVADDALLEADYIIRHMFAYRHDILRAMIDAGVCVVVIGVAEPITDIPEYRGLKIEEHGDEPLRGLEYTPQHPLIGCGEENLLNYAMDSHAGESVLIGELADALHRICGLRPVDKDFHNKPKQQYELRVKRIDTEFDDRLRQLYERALEKGRWKGSRAARSPEEYWVEGVQSWFDCNRESDTRVGENDHVNTREKLEGCDPDLASLIAEAFCHSDRVDWRYQPYAARKAP